jgi:hypothetical protein
MHASRPPADQLYQHLPQLHDDAFEAQRYAAHRQTGTDECEQLREDTTKKADR